jgi:hypothetical protein
MVKISSWFRETAELYVHEEKVKLQPCRLREDASVLSASRLTADWLATWLQIPAATDADMK